MINDETVPLFEIIAFELNQKITSLLSIVIISLIISLVDLSALSQD